MEVPDSPETYFINHFKDGECYLAINGINKEFGTWFSIKEDNRVLYEGASIGKMVYYNYRIKCNPKNPSEETLMVDFYYYNDGLLDKIIRDSFWEKKSTSLPTRTFSFEYYDKNVSIYSEQANMNNEIIKSKFYTGEIKG